jgi:uncharacterized membrane protein YedE/YeeE
MLELLQKPWPWYISGPLIGLMVPLLLLLGNKPFGLSSSLKHICAMCSPIKVDFFDYDWKKEIWNLVLVTGIIIGGWLAANYLNPTINISKATQLDMKALGIYNTTEISPAYLFSWSSLGSFEGFVLIITGGFLVGFGTRYADGCTSGHAIMGLSIMSWPSLIAVIGFFVGGLITTHLILPFIL